MEARNNELATIAKKNEEEIKNLNSEKQEIYNQSNKFKTILILRRNVITLFMIIVLALATVLIVLRFLYIRKIKRILRKAKKKHPPIYNLQQNQQVKTPGNNVDNKKFIVKVVNDKIGEIYRQLQQEIDQRWDIKSRNLQNQINQLQQNQKLRTSDNVAGVHRESRRTTNHLTSQVTPVPQMNPQIPTHQYSGSSDMQLISMYQQNYGSLLKNATQVSETEQSIDQRRLGGAQGAILRKDRKGNYWVLQEGGVDYMVPKNNIKINEYSLNTVANLFECQGYRSGYSGFQLIKPARVSAISRGETWQLVELGVLQFY